MVKIDQDVTGRIWVFFANVSKKKNPQSYVLYLVEK
jgi:hypothetical protein